MEVYKMCSDSDKNKKENKIYIHPDSFYKPPIFGFFIVALIYVAVIIGACVFLKCCFEKSIASIVLIISASVIIITSIICFTIFSIRMLGHIMRLKKMKVISEMTEKNDSNFKPFVNAITDL